MDNPSSSTLGAMNTRGYQQEMLEESLGRNLIIALDTGSGKTHIAVLRMKIEAEREPKKVGIKTTRMMLRLEYAWL
jgi:ERCC4-related helicase